MRRQSAPRVRPLKGGGTMQRVDVTEFVQKVIADLDDVPEGFEQRLIALVGSAPTTRWSKILDLFKEVARG